MYDRAQALDQLAQTDNELGALYWQSGQYAQAELFYDRGRGVAERSGDPALLARSLNGLATVDYEQDRLDSAESHYGQALTLLDEALGPNSAESANILGNMGLLKIKRGRNSEAEELLQRALTMPGRSKTDTARDVANLAILYTQLGRIKQAEPLAEQAVALNQDVFGPDHPVVATAQHNLASIYATENRLQEAERLERRALATRERAFGPTSPIVATSLNALAADLKDEHRDAEAKPLYQRAIDIDTAAFGQENGSVAAALRNLAMIYMDEGHADQADRLLVRALGIRERLYGPDHPAVARNLIELAAAELAEGFRGSAGAASVRGSEILERWLAEPLAERTEAVMSERRMYRQYFLRTVSILATIAEQEDGPDREGSWDHAFISSQLAQTSAASQMLAAMAARFAAGNDDLAASARERSDLVERSAQLGARTAQAFSQKPTARNAEAERDLLAESASLRQRLDALESTIATRFPRFAELSHPRPVTRQDAQSLLGAHEALVAFTVTDDDTYVWVLRNDRSMATRIDISTARLAEQVTALRQALDPARNGNHPPFDVKGSYALYQKLLAPAASLLDDASHVMVVPDGALQSLPLGVLVTAPAAPVIQPAGYRAVPWFARTHAVTILPSVSSLRSLRRFAAPSKAPHPFIGIGDPVLGARPDCRPDLALASAFRGGVADLESLRQLCALPETREELRALARSQGASADHDVFLADQATKRKVQSLPLANYRIVAFATHGLVAGEIPNLAEPALVLTPPSSPAPGDDGLLTASEVALLKLDADWVILSACNTAAGNMPGAEGLSGLAQAFFYAGARSLLVSHWQVLSGAAEELTVSTLGALRRDRTLGRAEALRLAEMDMLDNGDPALAAPAAWAAFSQVGADGHPKAACPKSESLCDTDSGQ
jgi:CHAT domain-containing protein/tetratricopeptide (TPR) repeat protein